LQFHLLALAWLEPARGGRPLATKIRRCTGRAVTAICVASSGHRCRQNVASAQQAIVTAAALFELLAAEGEIGARIYAHALRRIDQIILALEELGTTPIEQWPMASLPPLEAESPPENHERYAAVKRLIDQVAGVLRSMLQSATREDSRDGASTPRRRNSGKPDK
jgi:hypothetical protein